MAEKLEYFSSIGTPISQEEYGEEYQQICPDCGTRLCEDTLIMIYAGEDEEETTFCDNCYWLNNHYKDDRWEDNVGEVSEYVKSRGLDATEVFLLVPAHPGADTPDDSPPPFDDSGDDNDETLDAYGAPPDDLPQVPPPDDLPEGPPPADREVLKDGLSLPTPTPHVAAPNDPPKSTIEGRCVVP